MSTAQRYVKLAAAVDAAPVPLKDAVAGAQVNLDQAEVIARSVAALPREVGVEVGNQAAAELVRLAGELDPGHLDHVGKHVLRVVAPDAADEADRKTLQRAEARARDGRGFTMSPDANGFGYRISGRLTNEGAAVIRAAIDPLCNPARNTDALAHAFDGHGRPLDAGRTKRLVSGVLRQALLARDRGCTFPGCDRGPRWTEGHHIVSWAAGGPTALPNLALLCQFHHTEIHKPGGWTMHMAPDGLPSFIPPPRIDPQQTPRRNRYHQRE